MKFDAKLESNVLDWLRFPMIILVVYIHWWGVNTQEVSLGTTIYNALRIFMCHVISRAAVPTFFLISGYYYFLNTNFSLTTYKSKLKKRIQTILIPYLLWNLIVIGKVVILHIGAWLVKGKPLSNLYSYFDENGWLDLFWSSKEWFGRTNWLGNSIVSTSPELVPMWYLRDLMVFFILTPILYFCIRKFSLVFLVLLFGCYVSGIWIQIPGFSLNIIYFAIGAYLALNNKSIVSELYTYRWFFYIAVLIMLPFMIYYDGTYTSFIGNVIYPFFVFALTPCYINIATFLMLKGKVKPKPILSKASFFVYALHTLILGYCASIVTYVMYSDYWILASIRYMLIPIFCVIICLYIYTLMSKFTPRILSLLMGGR